MVPLDTWCRVSMVRTTYNVPTSKYMVSAISSNKLYDNINNNKTMITTSERIDNAIQLITEMVAKSNTDTSGLASTSLYLQKIVTQLVLIVKEQDQVIKELVKNK